MDFMQRACKPDVKSIAALVSLFQKNVLQVTLRLPAGERVRGAR